LKPDGREQLVAAMVSLGQIHHMSTKLFVGNLSFNTTENDLQDAFAQHGTVVEANLMMDRMTGRPRGFGFVTMEDARDAEEAVKELDGTAFMGRDIKVNLAKEKPQRGKVVAVGTGKKDEPMTCKVGDIVLYGKYAGTEVQWDGKDYLIMRESDIFAIV